MIYNREESEKYRPILTVAIPTYNGARTIGRMLDILLPQVTEEIEVIVSDNCSTDGTRDIISNYRKEYPFINFRENEENKGADLNFLKCMLEARGKFVMLVSDDDILVEGALETIVEFLTGHPGISMAYMDSVAFKDNYTGVGQCHRYKRFSTRIEQSKEVSDKSEFLKYAQRLFGFTSCHIWSTERIREIPDPGRFVGTFFMQAYISILCSNRTDDRLGLIAGPCIAVGEYGSLGNYNLARVEGAFYHRMIEFAIENGYPGEQLEKYYIWKIIYLGRIYLIKERAIGIHQTKCRDLFSVTYRYPGAWIKLYPFFLLPPFICRSIIYVTRKIQGRNFTSYVNRPTTQDK